MTPFEEFWHAWPQHHRKYNKAACLRKWNLEGLDARSDHVLGSLRSWIASDAWQEGGGKFIPAPQVWLNQARYEVMPTALARPAHVAQCQATVRLMQEMAEADARAVKGDAVRARVAAAKARVAEKRAAPLAANQPSV